jgi:hypothetical protein
VRAALAVVDTAAVARRLKCKARSIRNYRYGSRMPPQPHELAAAIVACAADAGLFLPGDETLDDEQFCALLPERVGRLQLFIAAAIEIFGDACGLASLADADEVLEQRLRRWRDLAMKGGPRSADILAETAARFGKIARARIITAGHRAAFDSGLIGHAQAIYAALSLVAGRSKPLVIDRNEIMSYMGGIASIGFSIFPHPAAEIAGRLGKKEKTAIRALTEPEVTELLAFNLSLGSATAGASLP